VTHPSTSLRAGGLLIAFEGLDQSGKQTQAELLRDRLIAAGRAVRLLSFPDYGTPIGEEIERALRGARNYAPDVMQLLYVANRYEFKGEILRAKQSGTIVLCDRYLASSIAYGEAQGLDAAWLTDIQKYLPQPDIAFLLDIAPEVSAKRKTTDRDRYERDLSLLSRVRNSYLRQADADGWVRLDAARPPDVIAGDVYRLVGDRLRERDR
jgi:dTMP kinase